MDATRVCGWCSADISHKRANAEHCSRNHAERARNRRKPTTKKDPGERRCLGCDVDISHRHVSAKRCTECAATCSIEGCDGAQQARGWCPVHWGNWHRTGDPLGTIPRQRKTSSFDPRKPGPDRRSSRTVRNRDLPAGLIVHDPTAWLVDADSGIVYSGWYRRPIGVRDARGGYMVAVCLRLGGSPQNWRLHRVVWEAAVGPIPDDREINHLNGVKSDNRLSNLECVSAKRNTEHAIELGLSGGGIKLDWDKVALIRQSVGVSDREFAERFGVSPKAIEDARLGRTWVAGSRVPVPRRNKAG